MALINSQQTPLSLRQPSLTTAARANASGPVAGIINYLNNQKQMIGKEHNDLHRAIGGFNLVGLASDLPPAGQAGRSFFATDTNVFSKDSGSAWVAVGNAMVGTAAARPATAGNGQFYFATDTGILSVFSGGQWNATGNILSPVVTSTTPFTAAFNTVVLGSATATANQVINLPAFTGSGQSIRIVRLDNNGSHLIAVTPASGNTINGNASAQNLSQQYSHITVYDYAANAAVLI